MEGATQEFSASAAPGRRRPPLNTVQITASAAPNRAFAAVYLAALSALFYRHFLTLYAHSTTLSSLFMHLSFLLSDALLAFMWLSGQAFRMCPVRRREFPENLGIRPQDFPALDVLICTADPHKEPPAGVVNTALSAMAYDYPPEKVSVYLSDDGGSELTLFAFLEATKFARHWLPFCRERKIVERSPEAYFGSNREWCSETEKIKILYDSMKNNIEDVVERGKIEDTKTDERWRNAFSAWTNGLFTHQDHPTVIQVLLERCRDKDIKGQPMPNLVYVSRQKSKGSPHHFKAGALNALVRVSATMTNAPIILTLDCDTYSNDPKTPLRALCYIYDPAINSTLGYVQFPQHFHGINKNDTYGSEYKRLFQINTLGMDGLRGPNYVGSGCFFSRRALFGGPESIEKPDMEELCPNHVVEQPIQSPQILELAHKVAGSKYENQKGWGDKMGFKYGSLVEDFYTGYRLQCEGWRSAFCNPDRSAFLGDVPLCLSDLLVQYKRWSIGLLEVSFSKYNPLVFGLRAMGPLMGLCYAHYASWPIWSIPITFYAFVPQLALLHGIPLFSKVSDVWFLLYAFLFVGSYGQDLLHFLSTGGTFCRWWSDQRMWMVRGLCSSSFALVEHLLNSLGLTYHGFNVTSKVVDEQEGKRYRQGIFTFGVASHMFIPLVTAAIVNLFAFLYGFAMVLRGKIFEGGFVTQMFIAGYVVVNCWPIYEAMLLRSDKGKIRVKTTITSVFLAWTLYAVTTACVF